MEDGCTYMNTLRFWEERLAEHYYSGMHSEGGIQYLCLVGMVRELHGMLEVSLEVQQKVLLGKNLFKIRAEYFRTFQSFSFSIFSY